MKIHILVNSRKLVGDRFIKQLDAFLVHNCVSCE
jgi:hypothetical protein